MIDFLHSMIATKGGASQMPTLNAMMAAWGHRLDSMQQAVFDILTNRIPGYETDPTAALREFGLPMDKRLSPLHWQYSRNRGTKQNIVDMLQAIGHNGNVAFYNVFGRVDFGVVPSLPTDANGRYLDAGAYQNLFAFHGGSWFTVVVCDGLSNKKMTTIGGTNYTSGSPTTVGTAQVFADTSPLPPSAYGGPLDERIIEAIVRYNTCKSEKCLEVIVLYENVSTGLSSSLSSHTLDPATSNDRVSYINISRSNTRY